MKLFSNSNSLLRQARGFSLVEVTLALGLVSYVLLGLLGLMVVGLNSSRESTVETALSQIALHVSSTYDGSGMSGGALTYEKAYSYAGTPLSSPTDPGKYFTAKVEATPSEGVIPNGTKNLHLIKVSITSAVASDTKKVLQTSAFIP